MQFAALRATMSALLFGAALSAAPIIGSGGFTPFGSDPNQDGSPFWDQVSADGSGCGAGYVLTQSGSINNCANKRNAITTGLGLNAADLEYYSDNGFVTPFTLSAGHYSFTLHGGLYGARLNAVGYQYIGDATYYSMFDTSDLVGGTFDLDAAGEFRLWIESDNNSSLLFQSNDPSGVRVAAFHNTNNGRYYFGFEDRLYGDRDYNDTILSTSFHTPEPATFALMGAGLIAIALIGRRRSGS